MSESDDIERLKAMMQAIWHGVTTEDSDAIHRILTKVQLLSKAVAFDVGPEAFICGNFTTKRGDKYYSKLKNGKEIEVEYRYHIKVQYTGSKWVISNDSCCLNKLGEWEYRSDNRGSVHFDSPEEAIGFFERHRSWEWETYNEIRGKYKEVELFDELYRRVAEKYKVLNP